MTLTVRPVSAVAFMMRMKRFWLFGLMGLSARSCDVPLTGSVLDLGGPGPYAAQQHDCFWQTSTAL